MLNKSKLPPLPLHLRRLPRKRNLMIRIRRPPKLDRNLDTQLLIVHHQARKHNDESDAGVAHQEREERQDMVLPRLPVEDSEDGGEQLHPHAVEETCARRLSCERRYRAVGCLRILEDIGSGRGRGAWVERDECSEAPVVEARDNVWLRIDGRRRRQSSRRGRIRSGLGHLERLLV
jgi:hypothetical protein